MSKETMIREGFPEIITEKESGPSPARSGHRDRIGGGTAGISRRTLAKFSAAGALASLTAACAGQTQDQLANDVNLLVNGVSGIVGTLANPALKVPADVLAQVNAAITDLRANAAAIGTALTPNANAVQKIGEVVSALAAVVAPFFPVAPIVSVVVQAALALIPTILSFVHAPAPAAAAAASSAMSAAQARAVLRDAPAMLGAH